MTTKILPEKHVRLSESLVGLGAIILGCTLERPQSLEGIWKELHSKEPVHPRINGSITFDSVVLSIDFLFAIGAIRLTNEGLLDHATD